MTDVCMSIQGFTNYVFVAHYLGITSSCKMSRRYFRIGHGKGEWDGAGAIMKRALRIKQFPQSTKKILGYI